MIMSEVRRDLEEKLTSDYLNEIFRYDEETGKIYHKRKQPGIQYGGEAGCAKKYRSVKINQRLYRVHRVIWCMVYGSFPKDCLDHINGDKHDNRLSNLRAATRSQNSMNQPAKQSNTGYRNVSYKESKKSYAVSFSIKGKRHRWYRVKLSDAIKLAEEKRAEIQGDFAYVE